VDKLHGSSVACRGPQGTCDVPEFCTGSSVSCPAPGPILACDAGAPPADTAPPPADTAPPPADMAAPPPDTAPACPSDVTEVVWNPVPAPAGLNAKPQSAVVVWNGTGYTQAWYSQPDNSLFQTLVGRLDASGVEVPGSRAIASMNGQNVGPSAIAFSGSGHGVVYTYGTFPSEVYFRPLNASGTPTGSEIVVSQAPMPGQGQNTASIAWGPTNGEWGVIWNDSGSNKVTFRRVSAAGAAVGSPTAVSPASAFTSHAGGPVLIWNGTSYATTWLEGTADIVAFISKDGTFVSKGTATPAGTPTGLSPALAHRPGVGYGVVWIESPGAPEARVLAFGRTDTAGNAIAGSRVVLNTPGMVSQDGGVAWTGTDWVVTWVEGPNSAPPQHVWTARIDANGALVAGSRRAVTCANARDSAPYLAWSGSKAAVTFMRNDAEGRMVIFP
jgi:hypothetical protein